MIEIYKKKSYWCTRDENGKQKKFATEALAKASIGFLVEDCCECEDCKCDPCECNEDE